MMGEAVGTDPLAESVLANIQERYASSFSYTTPTEHVNQLFKDSSMWISGLPQILEFKKIFLAAV